MESIKVDTNKNKFIEILTKSPKNENSNKISCDLPQHSIIIYKNGKQSFIDICFMCKKIHVSQDIDFSEKDFDDEKWNQLKVFFQNAGINENYNNYP